jgi:hypothetical protein
MHSVCGPAAETPGAPARDAGRGSGNGLCAGQPMCPLTTRPMAARADTDFEWPLTAKLQTK